MRHWKLLGLAGLAGVAASGVVIVRAERRRQAFTPDDVRERLRQRYDAAAQDPEGPTPDPSATSGRARRARSVFARRRCRHRPASRA